MGRGRHAVVALLSIVAVTAAVGWTTRARDVQPRIVLVASPAHTGWHIPSASMEPTLHCARPGLDCLGRYPDWPVVAPIQGVPPRGDIVAFRVPHLAIVRCGSGGVFIKRVIGAGIIGEVATVYREK